MPVLFLGVLMGALDIAIVGPALPAMKASFGINERMLSWVFSIYILFNLVGTPIMDKLRDRFGRKVPNAIRYALLHPSRSASLIRGAVLTFGTDLVAGAGDYARDLQQFHHL